MDSPKCAVSTSYIDKARYFITIKPNFREEDIEEDSSIDYLECSSSRCGSKTSNNTNSDIQAVDLSAKNNDCGGVVLDRFGSLSGSTPMDNSHQNQNVLHAYESATDGGLNLHGDENVSARNPVANDSNCFEYSISRSDVKTKPELINRSKRHFINSISSSSKIDEHNYSCDLLTSKLINKYLRKERESLCKVNASSRVESLTDSEFSKIKRDYENNIRNLKFDIERIMLASGDRAGGPSEELSVDDNTDMPVLEKASEINEVFVDHDSPPILSPEIETSPTPEVVIGIVHPFNRKKCIKIFGAPNEPLDLSSNKYSLVKGGIVDKKFGKIAPKGKLSAIDSAKVNNYNNKNGDVPYEKYIHTNITKPQAHLVDKQHKSKGLNAKGGVRLRKSVMPNSANENCCQANINNCCPRTPCCKCRESGSFIVSNTQTEIIRRNSSGSTYTITITESNHLDLNQRDGSGRRNTPVHDVECETHVHSNGESLNSNENVESYPRSGSRCYEKSIKSSLPSGSGGRELSSNNNELGKQDEEEDDDEPSDTPEDVTTSDNQTEASNEVGECLSSEAEKSSAHHKSIPDNEGIKCGDIVVNTSETDSIELSTPSENVVTPENKKSYSFEVKVSKSDVRDNKIDRVNDLCGKDIDLENDKCLPSTSKELGTPKTDNMNKSCTNGIEESVVNETKSLSDDCAVISSHCNRESSSEGTLEVSVNGSEEPVVKVSEAPSDNCTEISYNDEESITEGTIPVSDYCPEVLVIANEESVVEVNEVMNDNYSDISSDENKESTADGAVGESDSCSEASVKCSENSVIQVTEAMDDNCTDISFNDNNESNTEGTSAVSNFCPNFYFSGSEEPVIEVSEALSDNCTNDFSDDRKQSSTVVGSDDCSEFMSCGSEESVAEANESLSDNCSDRFFNCRNKHSVWEESPKSEHLFSDYAYCCSEKRASPVISEEDFPLIPAVNANSENFDDAFNLCSQTENTDDNVDKALLDWGYFGCIMNKSPSSSNSSIKDEVINKQAVQYPEVPVELSEHGYAAVRGQSSQRISSTIGQDNSTDGFSRVSYSPGPSSPTHSVASEELSTTCHNLDSFQAGTFISELTFQSLDLESADHSKPTHTDPNGPSTSRYLPQSGTDNDNTNEDIAFEVLNLSRTNDSNTKKGIASEALNLSSTNDPNTKASDSLDLESADTSKPTHTDRNGLSTSRYLPQSRTDHTNNNEIIASDSLNSENAKEGFALGPSNLCITNDPYIKENVAFKALNLSRTSIPDSSEDIAPKAVHLSSTNNPIYEDITSDSLILSGTNNSNTIEDIASETLNFSNALLPELGYTQKSSEDDISNISTKDSEVNHDEEQSFIHENNVKQDSEVVGNLAVTSATNNKEIEFNMDTGKLLNKDNSPIGKSTWMADASQEVSEMNKSEPEKHTPQILSSPQVLPLIHMEGKSSEGGESHQSSLGDLDAKECNSEVEYTTKEPNTSNENSFIKKDKPKLLPHKTNELRKHSQECSSHESSYIKENIASEISEKEQSSSKGQQTKPLEVSLSGKINVIQTSIEVETDPAREVLPLIHVEENNSEDGDTLQNRSGDLDTHEFNSDINIITKEPIISNGNSLTNKGQLKSFPYETNDLHKNGNESSTHKSSYLNENIGKEISEKEQSLSNKQTKPLEVSLSNNVNDNQTISEGETAVSREVCQVNESEPAIHAPQNNFSPPPVLPLIDMEFPSISEGGETRPNFLGDLRTKECNSDMENTTKEPIISNENSFAKNGEPKPYKTNEVHNNRNECNSHKSYCIKQTICKQISEEEQSSSNKDTEPLDVSLNNNINDIQIIAELETDASREVYEMNESEPPKCTQQNNISSPHVSPLLNMKDNYLEGAETLQNQFGDLGTKQCTSDVENTTNEPSTSNEMHENTTNEPSTSNEMHENTTNEPSTSNETHENINECYTHESSYIKQDIVNEISEREQLSSNEQIEPVEVSLHNNVNEIQPISEPETAVSREVCQVNESEVPKYLGKKKRGRPKKIQSLVGGDANDLNPSSEPEPSEETPQRILRSSSRVNIPFNMRNVSAKDLPKCEIQLTSINSIRSLKEIMKQNGVTQVSTELLNFLLKKSPELPKCEVKVPRINSFSHLMQIMNENGLTGDPSALRHMWNNSSVSNDELRKERVLGAAKHETSRYLRSSAKRKINEPTEKPNKRQHLDSSKPSTSHSSEQVQLDKENTMVLDENPVSVKQPTLTDFKNIRKSESVHSHLDSPKPSTSHGHERVQFVDETTMVPDRRPVSVTQQTPTEIERICKSESLPSHSHFDSPQPSTSHGSERVQFVEETTMVPDSNPVSVTHQQLTNLGDIRRLDSIHSVFEQLIKPTLNDSNIDLSVNHLNQNAPDTNQSVLLRKRLTEFFKKWTNKNEEPTAPRFSEVPKLGIDPRTQQPCSCTLSNYSNDCTGCKNYYDTIIYGYILKSQISNAGISKISQQLHRENNNFSLPTNNAVLSCPVSIKRNKRQRKASDKQTKRICIRNTRNTNRQEPSQSLQSVPSTSTQKEFCRPTTSRPMRKCKSRTQSVYNTRQSRMIDESTCPESSSSEEENEDSDSSSVQVENNAKESAVSRYMIHRSNITGFIILHESTCLVPQIKKMMTARIYQEDTLKNP